MVFLHIRDEWKPVTDNDVVILDVRNKPDGGVDVSFYFKTRSATTQVLQLEAIESSIEVCMLVTYQKGIVLLSSCLNEVLGNFA